MAEPVTSESETELFLEPSEIALKSPKKIKSDARLAEKIKMAQIVAAETKPSQKKAAEKGITRAKRILNNLVPKGLYIPFLRA